MPHNKAINIIIACDESKSKTQYHPEHTFFFTIIIIAGGGGGAATAAATTAAAAAAAVFVHERLVRFDYSDTRSQRQTGLHSTPPL